MSTNELPPVLVQARKSHERVASRFGRGLNHPVVISRGVFLPFG